MQIAARTVSGIDSYVKPGESVERGAIFGMIQIGSQVDLVVPWRADLRIRVRAGDSTTHPWTIAHGCSFGAFHIWYGRAHSAPYWRRMVGHLF